MHLHPENFPEGTFEKPAEVNLDYWPIEINDAPILCGRCHFPVVGSGYGTFGVLMRLMTEHARKCETRNG